MCKGLVAVLLLPSPKFQLYAVALVEVLLKITFVPEITLLKLALGPGLTVMVVVAVLLPALLLAVSVTV